MKTINYLKSTMKELQHAPMQYDREIAEIIECIAELEALQQPKNNCDTCKWDDYCGTEENCLSSKYIKDRYEPKGK